MSEEFGKLVSVLIKSGDLRFMVEHPEIAEYVTTSAIDTAMHAIIDSHVVKYGKLPAMETFVKTYGEALPEPQETPEYYLGELWKGHIQKTLSTAAVEAKGHMLNEPEKALDMMTKACTRLQINKAGISIIDYRKSAPFILKHLQSKWAGANYISMGWPTFDQNSGGLMAGDFISLIGFTGAGKTQLLLSRAMHFWETLKLPTVFISGEMNLAQILERTVALDSHIPADFLKHGALPNVKFDFKKKLIDTLTNAGKSKTPFHFVDANLAMDEDAVLKVCNQLQPKILCIDGAAVLGGSNYTRRWEQIASFATFVKQQICQRMAIPCIASYQFSNEARKDWYKKSKSKKGSTIPNISDIAGSGEVANLSSVCLGMTPDDTPESTNRRKVTILKGRGGEVGSFLVNWDWQMMDFQEYIIPTGSKDDEDDDSGLVIAG